MNLMRIFSGLLGFFYAQFFAFNTSPEVLLFVKTLYFRARVKKM